MASEPDLSSGATEDRAAVRRELIDELRELDERLRTMVDEYEAKPSAFDISLKATGTAVDIEAAITEVYRIMKTRVYAEDSPLRVESDIWEPFDDQKDEFFDSYKSAVMALETYKEVFETYEFVKSDAEPRPQRGELERVRQDKHALVEERQACIDTVSNFYGKFSAMLTIL